MVSQVLLSLFLGLITLLGRNASLPPNKNKTYWPVWNSLWFLCLAYRKPSCAVQDSLSFWISAPPSLVLMPLSSCLLTHSHKMVAPPLDSRPKYMRRKDKGKGKKVPDTFSLQGFAILLGKGSLSAIGWPGLWWRAAAKELPSDRKARRPELCEQSKLRRRGHSCRKLQVSPLGCHPS